MSSGSNEYYSTFACRLAIELMENGSITDYALDMLKETNERSTGLPFQVQFQELLTHVRRKPDGQAYLPKKWR